MVIVKLNGGLGNQLFQYAAGRRLSIFHKTAIRLDLGIFDYHKLRQYSLSPFRIKEYFANPIEVGEAQSSNLENRLTGISAFINKIKPCRRWYVFRESYLRPYNAEILQTSRNVYLDGYWQSEKYFIDIQDIIRREFTLQNELSRESERIAGLILKSESVSIHVRRADYVSDPATHQTHGVCELGYYHDCVNLIRSRVPNPSFFVFSDDISWCRESLRFVYPAEFIGRSKSRGDHEDLKLMSLCKHNIIANSSFSWWAGWLNENENKIVVAPSQWFKNPKYDTRDLIPFSWLRINSWTPT